MTTIVALTGASGSGKSTLAQALLRQAGEGVTTTLLPLDAYYRDLSGLSFDERDRMNFDHPDAIEFELFEHHIGELRAGRAIDAPVYDFGSHTRASHTQHVESADLVLIEGLLLGAWDALAVEADHVVWVETPLSTCLERRIARDRVERGRSEASVREFWRTRALPAFSQWGSKAQGCADLVVSGEIPVEEARQLVAAVVLP